MKEYYPVGPRTADVDHGIFIRTLWDKCPEFEIETKISDECIDDVISYKNQNLYFIMDDQDIIHQFFCYETDEPHPVIELICERLKVDWVKRVDYKKLVDKDSKLPNYTLDPNVRTIDNKFGTKDLANLVLQKNRASQQEKLEPRQFYSGVFRMFCQINTKPVLDTDEIWEASIVLYREFLISKHNKSSFNKSEEISQINDFLDDTIAWAKEKSKADELPF